MEVEEVPNVNLDEIINEMPSEKTETTLPLVGEMATDMVTKQMPHYGDDIVAPIQEYLLYTPTATSSKAKYNNASKDMKKKEIQEFFRVIRPHLPRKSKSKAYKLLKNIAKGTVVMSSFQQRIRKKKPTKKRPVRKQNTRRLKTKSLSIVRRNERSLCSSSDSCRSNTSCAQCGYSCSRIARW